jgi:hypothetical protein
VQGKSNSYPVTPSGIGLLCGQNSHEYLIAVDCDGFSAYDKLKEISGSDRLPPTVAFTSNREGRCQYLFKIPQPIFPLKSRRFVTKEGEALEIRGAKMQSVLPPSVHPLTGQYQWLEGGSPAQVEVAIAPSWLVELMKPPKTNNFKPDQPPSYHYSNHRVKITRNQAKLLLSVIHPRFADDYHSWIRVGLCLKTIGDDLLPQWQQWSQLSSKYKQGECPHKWTGFKGIGPSSDYLLHLTHQS